MRGGRVARRELEEGGRVWDDVGVPLERDQHLQPPREHVRVARRLPQRHVKVLEGAVEVARVGVRGPTPRERLGERGLPVQCLREEPDGLLVVAPVCQAHRRVCEGDWVR